MRIILRALVGVLGLLGLLLALSIWANPDGLPAKLGLQASSLLGRATIRADMAGFFGAVGVLALAGALRNEARLLTAPLLLSAIALTGRSLTVAMDGFSAEMVQPMVIETVLVVVFGAGRRFLGVAPAKSPG